MTPTLGDCQSERRLSPDEADAFLANFVETLAETGQLDVVRDTFPSELQPFVREAARRACRQHFPGELDQVAATDEAVGMRLVDILRRVDDALEEICLNPDAQAVIPECLQLERLLIDLRNWQHFLSRRPITPQATVHPTAAAVMKAGGTP
jgi:hypothetical protein